jgi:hypothetical protein
MKKLMTLVGAMAIVGLVSGTGVLAQERVTWRGGGGWGPETPYARMYNPQTIETISGTVDSIHKIRPMKGMSYGVHTVVKTDTESISVHLGPDWYIENQDVQIERGDTITIKGSRITYDGKPAVVAAEVHRGDEVLVLRDAQGIPVWSGWRRR